MSEWTGVDWTVTAVFLVIIVFHIVAGVFSHFYHPEAVELEILTDKCTEDSAKFSYLILLTFDPQRKFHFSTKGSTLTVDLRDDENRHLTRFTVSPDILKTYLFVRSDRSLVKLKLLRLTELSNIGRVKLNHNVLRGKVFVYSFEIQDIQKNISYKADVNLSVSSIPLTDTNKTDAQTFVCHKRRDVNINQKLIPQQIIFKEFIVFLYLILNGVFLLCPLMVLQKEPLINVVQPVRDIMYGVIASVVTGLLVFPLLVWYRFHIKIRYALEVGSNFWRNIRFIFLSFLLLIGFGLGMATVFVVNMAPDGIKDQHKDELFHTWAFGWFAMFIEFIILVSLYNLYTCLTVK